MSLAGKVAFVTGGGRGIGRGISLALARRGADVVLTYRKDLEAANETVAEIEALGRHALAVACDVGQEDQVKAAVQSALAGMSRIDILVCNAGIASRGNLVAGTTTEEMRRVLDTHVMGSFWCCREAIPVLRVHGEGHIIFISSIATMSFGERGAPYCMAKSAMEALMKVITKEEGPNGIRVNAIGPGLIETDMGRRLVKARDNVDIEDLGAKYPFGRVGQPGDIGELAGFLCSPEGSYISGQVIYVHGGGFHKHEVA